MHERKRYARQHESNKTIGEAKADEDIVRYVIGSRMALKSRSERMALAKEVGISMRMLYYYAAAGYVMPLDKACLLARAVGCTISIGVNAKD